MDAWATGSQGTSLPSDVGIPFGPYTPKGKNFQYFILQKHWDNPSQQQKSDNSGLKISYTKTVKPMLMGNMILGKPVMNLTVIPKG